MIDLAVYTYIFYYIMTTIGITYGYHRCFAHKQIKVPSTVECIMLYVGTLCGGQSALSWSGVHRMHHAYADTARDPYSNKYMSWWQTLFSIWRVDNIPRKFIKDLYNNPRIMFFHKYRISILLTTWMIAAINNLLIYFIAIYVMSYISFGLLNLLGHDSTGPVNKWWINIFAPFEANHKDHHNIK